MDWLQDIEAWPVGARDVGNDDVEITWCRCCGGNTPLAEQWRPDVRPLCSDCVVCDACGAYRAVNEDCEVCAEAAREASRSHEC